jgi:hypothetical protein
LADHRYVAVIPMVLQLELDPATEARLHAEAEVRGLAVEKYAVSLLRDSAPEHPAGTGILTIQSFHQMLDEMAEGSENLPRLPTSAFSSEPLYEDHL